MRDIFKTRRLSAWIACFAILLNALAPSISHALSARDGRVASWVEICSVDGARLIALAADDAQPAGGAADGSQAQPSAHCPFCASHAGSFALPAPALSLLLPGSAPRLLPPLFYHAPRPLFSWAAANPRAPPAAL